MSIKNKPITNSKKPQNSCNLKEIFQHSQLTAEILRIIISRSEDIAMLKSFSDRKTGKLRVQGVYAEKSISEIEFKEEWRYSKEESLLLQLFTSRIDSPIQKKQLEKVAKKMYRINTQFEDDPSEKDFNLSEIHLHKIMSVKISQDNTFVNVNEKGQSVVTIPSFSITASNWRENFCGLNKVLESCLMGEVVNTYNSMYLCVKQSRNLYFNEINRQKIAVEEGTVGLSPNIAVLITSKKSKSSIVSARKALSPIKKPTPLPEPDFFTPLMASMLEANAEIEKSIKNFAGTYFARNGEDSVRNSKIKDPISKALRARNYEKFSAVNPFANNFNNYRLSTIKTLKSLHMQPEVLFDLENTYFDENCNLAERIKVIHSCLVIQNIYKERRKREIEKKIITVQKLVRGYLVRKNITYKKTEKIRKIVLWQRLKHWYPLLANKFREKKSRVSGKDYSIFYLKIVQIQKNIRGYIARKKVFWKKVFYNLRKIKNYQKFYMIKKEMWVTNLKFEELVLNNNGLEDTSSSLSTSIGSYYNNYVEEFGKFYLKEEANARKNVFLQAKAERIQILS